PDNPETVRSMNQLANVYQVALNTAAPPAGADGASPKSAGTAAQRHEVKKEFAGAAALRDRLTHLRPAKVRATVVPVLEQALRSAPTSEERQGLARALGQLGPAARPAIPALADCLNKAKEPAERCAVVEALGDIGPAAREAEPVLVQALKM